MANDIADRAADTVAHHTDEGLYQAQQALAQAGCADCKDCADPIPAARRKAVPSAQRCTECQGVFEMRQRRR
jgi:phage/conjugal plasmid C-4 type zinc finger TraR family protein